MADRTSRVLIYAPLGDDARALAEEVEAVGLVPGCLSDDAEFAAVLGDSTVEKAVFVVISQEGATVSAGRSLCRMHGSEPLWARLPVLFLINDAQRLPPACQLLRDCNAAPSFIYFERPARRRILRQAFRALSESRHRQFRTRDLMENLTEEKRHNVFLLGELRHRVRNSLAVLQSLFKMTLRRSETLAELEERFGARLRSMSDAHSRLTDPIDQPASLAAILEDHVTPYSNGPFQLRIKGDPVMLNEKIGFDLAMTVHELATNAAKYGALSTPSGQIDVSWSREEPSGNLLIIWRESGGPQVDPPRGRGLGSTIIESFTSGAARPPRIDFDSSGLVWRAQISHEDIL